MANDNNVFSLAHHVYRVFPILMLAQPVFLLANLFAHG